MVSDKTFQKAKEYLNHLLEKDFYIKVRRMMLAWQKQSYEDILKTNYSQTFSKIHRKVPLLYSLFNNKVAKRSVLI